MKYYSFFFLLLSISLSGQNNNLAKVDRYLQEYYEKIPVPGFSIVLVEGNKMLFSKGYGIEKVGSPQKITPESSLAIGAIGRGFTAVAILQLAEQGKLDLDAPVTTYLPWFKTANPNLSNQVTVRMCLNNTSAIPPMRDYIPEKDPTKSLDQFVRAMEGQYIQRKPGSSHEFCDEGYSIAGLIITEVSGMPYPEYVQKNIFKPLEMYRSTTDPEQFDKLGVLYGHEMLLDSCSPAEKETINTNYLPAGSEMRASANDLGRYLIALINEGKYRGKQILRPGSVQELFRSNTSFQGLGTMLGGNGIDIQYALGWMGMRIEEREIMIHTGNNGTMAAIIAINKEKDQGFAMLFNGDINRLDRYVYPNMENTANNVIHLLNGEATTDFAVMRFEDPFDEDFDLPREKWDCYTGRYHSFGKQSPGFKDITIDVQEGPNGTLELRASKEKILKGHYQLQFTNESRAVLRNISHPREIQFKIYPNGSVGGLFMYGSEFKKKDPSIVKRFEQITNESGSIAFLFPKASDKTWKEDHFSATLPTEADTRLELSLVTASEQSFEKWVQTQIAGRTILQRGTLQQEMIKNAIWKEQSLASSENGEYKHYLFATYQNPVSQKEVRLMVRCPWGGFNSILQELISQFQQSVVF